MSSVSDSNKALQKEIKVMSKIFGENQKVLVSMKGMIDTLTSTLEHIQKQSKQINIIEEDTQKLYAGLNQVRTQSNLINLGIKHNISRRGTAPRALPEAAPRVLDTQFC